MQGNGVAKKSGPLTVTEPQIANQPKYHCESKKREAEKSDGCVLAVTSNSQSNGKEKEEKYILKKHCSKQKSFSKFRPEDAKKQTKHLAT